MVKCNGENCKAINGKGHSDECIKECDDKHGVPKCFDRAESRGRSFDNCRFYNECNQVKSICVNNPISVN